MGEVYFIADVYDLDDKKVANINSVVTDNDVLAILGIVQTSDLPMIKEINGRKELILSNYDGFDLSLYFSGNDLGVYLDHFAAIGTNIKYPFKYNPDGQNVLICEERVSPDALQPNTVVFHGGPYSTFNEPYHVNLSADILGYFPVSSATIRELAAYILDANQQGDARRKRNARTHVLSTLYSHTLYDFVQSKGDHSYEVFGPNMTPLGVLNHLKTEVIELEENYADIEEWCDVILLGIDGALRSCDFNVPVVVYSLGKKFNKVRSRTYPDWRDVDPNSAIFHVKDDKEGEDG